MTCPDCTELKRAVITVISEQRQLIERTKRRHPSPPERRRIHRLKADAYIAQQILQNHIAVCEETNQ